jgi:hypothetical protein
MAEIKRVVRSAPLSDFRQAVPDAGGGFRLMAQMADTAYEFLKPAAIKEQEAAGAALGNEMFRQQIGDPKGAFAVSRMNVPAGPNQGLANDVMGAIGKGSGGGDKLHGVDPRINEVLSLASQRTGIKIGVSEGLRTPDRQREMVAQGKSQTMNSKHLHGGAADYHIIGEDGKANWDFEAYRPLADEAKKVAAELGYDGFEWGGDWNTLKDGVHFQFKGGGAAPSGGTSTVAPSTNADMPPPTMLRDADGALTARLYSPLSGEILQAHNAAAGVAYQSNIMLKGAEDMMALSNQFLMDPSGFQQAAKGYMDSIVASAPDVFKADIRGSFEKEVQRRYLGMVEEQQRDTRQRANNSSAALVDRWSDNLVSAMVGGSAEEISVAQSELSGVLSARERLPGVAWTREQSENTMIKAGEAAQREVAKREKEQKTTWKSGLSLIGDAAMNGQTAADEAILENPVVRELLPDEWAEAASRVMLRDNMPSFMLMTPAEQIEALAEMKAQPVQADWEMDLLKAATDTAAANAKAWEDDPIKRAGEVLLDKPPALTNINPEDPASAVQAMAERQKYADDLVAAGYVQEPIYLSDEEAELLGQAMSKETPPELRAIMAEAIVKGFGPGADRVFGEIKSDDPTTKYAGKLMARGGSRAVAFEAMRGQVMMDEGLVQAPSSASSLSAISTDIASALSTVPLEMQGELRKFAVSIYAARARGVTEELDQKAIMEGAVQSALGQSKNRRGKVTGGVQTIGDHPVLLPPGVSGEDAQSALQAAFSAGQRELTGMEAFAQIGAALMGDDRELPQSWVGGAVPLLGGKPINQKLFENGNIRLVPIASKSGKYLLEVVLNGAVVDARNAMGMAYELDLQALIEAKKTERVYQPALGGAASISDLGISP